MTRADRHDHAGIMVFCLAKLTHVTFYDPGAGAVDALGSSPRCTYVPFEISCNRELAACPCGRIHWESCANDLGAIAFFSGGGLDWENTLCRLEIRSCCTRSGIAKDVRPTVVDRGTSIPESESESESNSAFQIISSWIGSLEMKELLTHILI